MSNETRESKQNDLKLRFSLAIPRGMVITTSGSFITHVGWRLLRIPPNTMFDTIHYSEDDRAELEAAIAESLRLAALASGKIETIK